jgi:hypothetical protein
MAFVPDGAWFMPDESQWHFQKLRHLMTPDGAV